MFDIYKEPQKSDSLEIQNNICIVLEDNKSTVGHSDIYTHLHQCLALKT